MATIRLITVDATVIFAIIQITIFISLENYIKVALAAPIAMIFYIVICIYNLLEVNTLF